MATSPTTRNVPAVEYPTGDGRPMAETTTHRDNMIAAIDVLQAFHAADPMVYVSGNMFIYYVPGQKRRHVSPDVFVARGVPNKVRDAYFVWEEGKGPDVVFEYTSPSTRREDLKTKFKLYQDTLRVREYFLFDPKEEYLKPSLQGHRLIEGHYLPIEPEGGRLFSEVLGLYLERDGVNLRFVDPATGRRLLTSPEAFRQAEADRQRAEADRQRAEADRQRAEAERDRADEALRQSEAARIAADADRERLRRELDDLRRRLPDGA